MSYRQMPTNIQLNSWIKNFIEQLIKNRRSCTLEGKRQDYKDGSGLQFIKFHFVTGRQEIKVFISIEV